MNDLEHIESHWQSTVSPSIIDQYRNSTNWTGVLKSIIDEYQIVEDDAYELLSVFKYDVSNVPTGKRLDWFAGLVNEKRKEDETDSELSHRIQLKISKKDSGTPDYVIRKVSDESGDTSTSYIEDAPARFVVYTHDKKQLPQRFVKRLSPAGVSGIVGAVFITAAGKRMMVRGGSSKFLCTANDSTIKNN